jgi:hypothetical protein
MYHLSSNKGSEEKEKSYQSRRDFQLLLSDHAPNLELHAPIVFHKAVYGATDS